jgi:ABC-type bacteriocin/lantibiotic exporter with double-glycine peptidase domain
MLIMDGMPKVQGIKPILNRLEGIIDYKDTSFAGTKMPTFNKNIRLNNVEFSYNEDRPVLKDMSLELQKNKKYAVVGHSGSGKSTLIRLLTGTYAGFDGEISYDGQELRTLDIQKLHSLISVIHQNVYMFSGSIRENICLHRSFSDDELKEALMLSGVKLFLDAMPDGLDSDVGENGNNLSGGQRQRIAVSRALIQKTPILILDEGTASIDKQTAYSIESSLLSVNDLTLVTITHNLDPELLGRYDQIILIKDGSICEMGSLDELLRHRGDFYSFYHLPQENEKATA